MLSNPPYVADSERASLAPEILRHEPPGALFAGPDGLAAIRALLAQTAARERVRLLALEVGAGQAGAVGELMRAAGFESVRTERDLAGYRARGGGGGERGLRAHGCSAPRVVLGREVGLGRHDGPSMTAC